MRDKLTWLIATPTSLQHRAESALMGAQRNEVAEVGEDEEDQRSDQLYTQVRQGQRPAMFFGPTSVV